MRLRAATGVFLERKTGVARNVSRFIESSGNGTGSFDEIGEAAVGQEGRERFARFAVLVRFVEGLNGRKDSRDGGFVDLVEFQKAVAESLGAYAEMAFHPENERVKQFLGKILRK